MLRNQTVAILMAVLLCAPMPQAYSADKQPSGRQVELHWSELGPFLTGGRVATVLPDGTVLEGRALAVNEDALVLDVSKSSDKQTYPKGRTSIPRDQITTLSLREIKGARGRITLTIAGVLGTLVAAGAILANAEDTGAGSSAVVLGVVAGGGTLGYFAGRSIDRKTTTIRIRRD